MHVTDACTKRSLRREFFRQDEAARSTPALKQVPGLHLGRQIALQLLAHMYDLSSGLTFAYFRNAPSSSWSKNSNPVRANQDRPLGGGTI